MTTVAWRIVADSDAAEDLTQDAFVELWNRRNNLPDDLKIKSYLRKIVVNKSLNHINRNKLQFFKDDTLSETKTDDDYQFEQIDYRSMQDMITNTVDKLPDKCRIIFSLSRYEEMSHKEIAQKLDISTKTIENQITIALKRIRNALTSGGFISLFILILYSIVKILHFI